MKKDKFIDVRNMELPPEIILERNLVPPHPNTISNQKIEKIKYIVAESLNHGPSFNLDKHPELQTFWQSKVNWFNFILDSSYEDIINKYKQIFLLYLAQQLKQQQEKVNIIQLQIKELE